MFVRSTFDVQIRSFFSAQSVVFFSVTLFLHVLAPPRSLHILKIGTTRPLPTFSSARGQELRFKFKISLLSPGPNTKPTLITPERIMQKYETKNKKITQIDRKNHVLPHGRPTHDIRMWWSKFERVCRFHVCLKFLTRGTLLENQTGSPLLWVIVRDKPLQ